MMNPSEVSKDIKRLKAIFKEESLKVKEFPNIDKETLTRFSDVFNDYIDRLDTIEEIAWRNYCYKNAFLFQNKLNKSNDLIIKNLEMINLVAKTLIKVNDAIKNDNHKIIDAIIRNATNERKNLEKI